MQVAELNSRMSLKIAYTLAKRVGQLCNLFINLSSMSWWLKDPRGEHLDPTQGHITQNCELFICYGRKISLV